MRRCFLACLLLRLPGRLLLDCFGPLRWLFLLYPRRGGTGRLLGRVRGLAGPTATTVNGHQRLRHQITGSRLAAKARHHQGRGESFAHHSL